MSVTIENNLITLSTKNSSYQMKADEYGVLIHTWYGSKTTDDMSKLLIYPDVGFAGSIHDAGNDRTYSMDTRPQELPVEGNGDYRTPGLVIRHPNGSRSLDLRFEKAKLLDQKKPLVSLPYVYPIENPNADQPGYTAGNGQQISEDFKQNLQEWNGNEQAVDIYLKDRFADIQVILHFGIFENENIITRSVEVINHTEGEIVLEKISPATLDFAWGDLDWIHFHGRHNHERQMERKELTHGVSTIGSRRGMSSHQQNPGLILTEPMSDESHGNAWGALLMYSGSFLGEVEKDQLDQTRLVLGLHPDQFEWHLASGQSFQSPEAILSFSDQGLNQLSQQYHSIINRNVIRKQWQNVRRPLLVNNWEATYFNFTHEDILQIAKQAKELGVEMMVLDDGWFGKRDSDLSGLGDWHVNEQKLQGSLKHLIDEIHCMDMKFGLWVEPEMISEDSDLYKTHPEWVIRIENRDPIRSRYQYVLDLANPAVVDYLYNTLEKLFIENPVDYVKWDYNRSISDWYTSSLPANRQKEMGHRYILGLYSLLERLIERFPHILFEGCAGGGGRFDAGMLYYTPQIWCSDDTDAYERCFIQHGTSFFYPASTIGSHISAVPNHQTGRITSLWTRGIVSMAGTSGYELDFSLLEDYEKKEAAFLSQHYKELQSLIFKGTQYRLSDPAKENKSFWSFVSPDKKTVLVQGVIFRTRPNQLQERVLLQGLMPDRYYVLVSENGKTMKKPRRFLGSTLMKAGLVLEPSSGDNQGQEYILQMDLE